jgi:hypothetical protein
VGVGVFAGLDALRSSDEPPHLITNCRGYPGSVELAWTNKMRRSLRATYEWVPPHDYPRPGSVAS